MNCVLNIKEQFVATHSLDTPDFSTSSEVKAVVIDYTILILESYSLYLQITDLLSITMNACHDAAFNIYNLD